MKCEYCLSGRENLCDNALYTGYQIDGGYGEYCVADTRFIFPIPSNYGDLEVAPLLCAGLIGYRALRMTFPAQRVGFFGFGASAHLLVQVIVYRGGKFTLLPINLNLQKKWEPFGRDAWMKSHQFF